MFPLGHPPLVKSINHAHTHRQRDLPEAYVLKRTSACVQLAKLSGRNTYEYAREQSPDYRKARNWKKTRDTSNPHTARGSCTYNNL